MSQNSMRLSWTAEEVDSRLHAIMCNIHKTCIETAKEFGFEGNYVREYRGLQKSRQSHDGSGSNLSLLLLFFCREQEWKYLGIKI
jgi:hypothetical protein